MGNFANKHSQSYEPRNAGVWAGRDVRSYAVQNGVGEGPCWHATQQCLYWIDVRAQQLLRLAPVTGAVDRWDLPEVVGALALCDGNEVCLALTRKLIKLNVDTGEIFDFAMIAGEPQSNRLNDGKVSPSGRWFVFGSMDDRAQKSATGALYRVSTEGDVRRLHADLTVCNGIASNVGATQLYFSDSSAGALYRAAWDEVRGDIGPLKTFALLDEAQGRPDGGTVDCADQYWSAGVSAGCINVLSATGQLIEKIALPCRASTMGAFGGAEGDELYVTSLIRPQLDTPGEHDGALLRIRLKAPGPVSPIFGSSNAVATRAQ